MTQIAFAIVAPPRNSLELHGGVENSPHESLYPLDNSPFLRGLSITCNKEYISSNQCSVMYHEGETSYVAEYLWCSLEPLLYGRSYTGMHHYDASCPLDDAAVEASPARGNDGDNTWTMRSRLLPKVMLIYIGPLKLKENLTLFEEIPSQESVSLLLTEKET